MTKIAVVLAVLFAVAFGGVLVWALMTNSQLEDTRAELSTTEAELAAVESALEETEDELVATSLVLEDTRHKLQTTEGELSSTKDTLQNTEDELARTNSTLVSTKNELSTTQTQLASTTEELESTEQQLTIAQETLDGLGIALSASADCTDADLIDSPDSANPTWAQLREFLVQDLTDTNTYILHEYDCSEFSRDVHNNAEAAGIRAAVVHVAWSGGGLGHALNAFLTSDYGLVYVDCTGGPDTVARVIAMKPYRSVSLPFVSIANIRNDWWWNSLYSYYYIPTDTGGQAKTEQIVIYW